MSKLSVMTGMRPTGLTDFVTKAKPIGVYALNNRVSGPFKTVFRVQNDVWSRLPDACSVFEYWKTEDPIASVHHELLGKTYYVPKVGSLNLLQYWSLSNETYYAPYNEWILGEGEDRFARADWMNLWNCEAIRVAAEHGIGLCLGSFATGNPTPDVMPHLYDTLESLVLNGGAVDVHEYGVEGPLMSSPSSGAFHYRSWYKDLPARCRVPIVISEFWWGNGFENGTSHEDQIQDAWQYGDRLLEDDYVLWASAFQLDSNAESNIPYDALMRYADYIPPTPEPPIPPDPEPGPGIPYVCKSRYPFQTHVLVVPQNVSYEALADAVTKMSTLKSNLMYSVYDAQHLAYASNNAGYPPTVEVWEAYKFTGGKAAVADFFSRTHANMIFHFDEAIPPYNLDAWRGLHMRADGHSQLGDFQALKVAKCNAALIMTNTGFDELNVLIDEGISPTHLVLRLFAAGDNPSLRDAARFVDEQSMWLDKFDSVSGIYVAVHNEPNLVEEGFGTAWGSPQEFGVWYRNVATLIKMRWPGLRIGWPGLSPQPNVPEWLPVLDSCLAASTVDWIGAHAYWIDEVSEEDPENGRYYRRFLGKGAPVIITEFNNNQIYSGDDVKGIQYRKYYATLEVGVLGAFCFVSSASNPDFNNRRMTWVRNGTLTQIPYEVGKV